MCVVRNEWLIWRWKSVQNIMHKVKHQTWQPQASLDVLLCPSSDNVPTHSFKWTSLVVENLIIKVLASVLSDVSNCSSTTFNNAQNYYIYADKNNHEY